MKNILKAFLSAYSYNRKTGALYRKFVGGHSRLAGSRMRTNDYIRVGFSGREYWAHRVAWLISYGSWPNGFIDHKNGNKRDNRLCNLRIATDSQNKRNVGKRSHNTSGMKGVSWDKANSKWIAHATLNGHGVALGRFTSKRNAAAAYKKFAVENHGEFYRRQA